MASCTESCGTSGRGQRTGAVVKTCVDRRSTRGLSVDRKRVDVHAGSEIVARRADRARRARLVDVQEQLEVRGACSVSGLLLK